MDSKEIRRDISYTQHVKNGEKDVCFVCLFPKKKRRDFNYRERNSFNGILWKNVKKIQLQIATHSTGNYIRAGEKER